MAFEKFVYVATRTRGPQLPIVSINKKGQALLNKAARTLLANGGGRYDLYVDRAGNRIGLDPHKQGMYKVPSNTGNPAAPITQAFASLGAKVKHGDKLLIIKCDLPPVAFEISFAGKK